MPQYTVTSDFDGNDQFEVDGKDMEEASLNALEVLGWYISGTKE